MSETHSEVALPWWRYGHVWLIISGPALVVIAGFITLAIALARPDPVVSDDDYRQGVQLGKQGQDSGLSGGLAPAMQARNHAATGVVPSPKPAQP